MFKLDSSCNRYRKNHIKVLFKDLVKSSGVCPDVEWKIRDL
jgi:hypothetical protein